MDFKNVRGMRGGGAASGLAKVAVLGGLGLYTALNSFYNVEGGHRAIVFNRLGGIKDEVLFSPLTYLFHIHILVGKHEVRTPDSEFLTLCHHY